MRLRFLIAFLISTLLAGGGAMAQQYAWTTAAGTPGGLGQANGTGTNAQFVYPAAVAADGSGNIYVADTVNQVIRKVAPGGVVTTFAGTAGVTGTSDGTGPAAQFNSPQGLAVDPSGNVYVADTGNQTIREITPQGVVSTIAGSPGVSGTSDGTGPGAQFNGPSALTVQFGTGSIFVADTANNTIRRIATGGVVKTVAGSPGLSGTLDGVGTAALFNAPAGIAVDGTSQIVFISDTGNNTIRKLLSNGTVSTYFGTPGISGTANGAAGVALFNQPTGITVDGSGRVYVADSGNDTIRRISTNLGALGSITYAGKPTRKGSANGAAATARFNDPAGITIDPNGVVYVADLKNSMIRAIDTSRNVTTLAGSPPVPGATNGPGLTALFNGPGDVALNGTNNLFVADTYNDVIRISINGVFANLAGSPGVSGTSDGTGAAARFLHPSGVVIDGSGNAYVADTGNHTIRFVTTSGVVSTYAGTPGVSGTNDGTGQAALFNSPQGIDIDPAGNVYVADTGNNTIRVIAPGGVVTTVAGTPGVTGTNDGAALAALFNAPQSLAVDGTNGVYIADTGNSTIRFLNSGTVSTFAGKAGRRGSADGISAARFNGPAGITVDTHHTLFVADTENETIREIATSGSVTTIGGMPGLIGSTVSTGTASQFALPQGLAATHADVLYVADALNNRIAKGTPIVGALTVTLTPAAAVTAGAQWNVDGGVFKNSGDTVTGLTPGNHTIGFNTLTGFISPTSQSVNITAFATTSATGAYIQQFGAVSVNIVPPGAITAGAQWNVDGGAPQASGTTVGSLTIGNHTINFTDATDYNTPASQVVAVTVDNTTATTGTYILQTGSISVTITPPGAITAGGQWNVDGGPEQASGNTVSALTLGSHTINFSTATGYVTPPSQMVNVLYNQTTTTTGNYAGVPVISVQQPAGTPLGSGSSTVDFGAVISGSSAQRQFEIVNIGTAPLTGLGLTITGADAAAFHATALTTGSLAIGGSATFIVTTSPIGLGSRTATLQVASDDPSTPDFDVALAVTGTGGPVDLATAAGSFAGLVSDTDAVIHGISIITLSKTGNLTGRLTIDGAHIPVKGAFDANGRFNGSPSTVAMTLYSGASGSSSAVDYQIAGNYTFITGTVPFIAWHAAYEPRQAVAEAPRYTVLLNGTDTAITIPQGTGHATLTVAKAGGDAMLSGKLADGTPFTDAGFIINAPAGHQLLVFDPKLYKDKGQLAGPITFEQLTDSDCDGEMQWTRPPISGDLYPQGFATALDLAGAIYNKPPKHSPALPFTSGTLYLTNGGLANPIVEPVTITSKYVLDFTGSNANQVSAVINPANGVITGKFSDSASQKPVPFGALLYQNPNIPGAGGFFIGPVVSGTSLSGNVTLFP